MSHRLKTTRFVYHNTCFMICKGVCGENMIYNSLQALPSAWTVMMSTSGGALWRRSSAAGGARCRLWSARRLRRSEMPVGPQGSLGAQRRDGGANHHRGEDVLGHVAVVQPEERIVMATFSRRRENERGVLESVTGTISGGQASSGSNRMGWLALSAVNSLVWFPNLRNCGV